MEILTNESMQAVTPGWEQELAGYQQEFNQLVDQGAKADLESWLIMCLASYYLQDDEQARRYLEKARIEEFRMIPGQVQWFNDLANDVGAEPIAVDQS